jgi:altronate hydrolase
VYGCRPVPSLKLASNREIFERMAGDMDIDCGGILEEFAPWQLGAVM